MTNILYDPLPDAVEIDGEAVPLNTDFRDGLRVILAFEDPDLTTVEQQAILLDNLYSEPITNVQQALEQGIRFLNGGDEINEDEAPPNYRLYSFRQDHRYIFAAFRQTHGVDLECIEYLHWWKFLALFMDLGADTTFCGLVSLRKRVKTGKATKAERRLYQEMRSVTEIQDPERLTAEEQAQRDEFIRLYQEGQKKREQEAAES
jgi:hypothetical protein